jgi:hypothetical protein
VMLSHEKLCQVDGNRPSRLKVQVFKYWQMISFSCDSLHKAGRRPLKYFMWHKLCAQLVRECGRLNACENMAIQAISSFSLTKMIVIPTLKRKWKWFCRNLKSSATFIIFRIIFRHFVVIFVEYI